MRKIDGSPASDATVLGLAERYSDESVSEGFADYESDSDRSDREPVTVSTDKDGRFDLSIREFPDLLYTAVWTDETGNRWFSPLVTDPEQITLSRQIVFGPTLATGETLFRSSENPLPIYSGVLIVWREFGIDDNSKQSLKLAITEAASGRLSGAGLTDTTPTVEFDPWEVSLDRTQPNRVGTDIELDYYRPLISSGSVWFMPPKTVAGMQIRPKGVLGSDSNVAAFEARGTADPPQGDRLREYLTEWHPTRRPEFPARGLTDRVHYHSISDDEVEKRTTAYDAKETLAEAMLELAKRHPTYGTALDISLSLLEILEEYDIDFHTTIGNAEPEALDSITTEDYRFDHRRWLRAQSIFENDNVASIVFEYPLSMPSVHEAINLGIMAFWESWAGFWNKSQSLYNSQFIGSFTLRPVPNFAQREHDSQKPAGIQLIGCVGSQIYGIDTDGNLQTLVEGIKTKGVATAADGTFWVTQQDRNRRQEHIRNVNRDGKILTRFIPPDEGTRGIDVDTTGAVGPPGHLYVVGNFSDAVFEITPDGEVVSEFGVPTREPVGVTVDTEGYVWITNQNEDIVYRTTPQAGELAVESQWEPNIAERSSVDEVRSNPHTAAIAVDGPNVWVKDKNGYDIYRYTHDGKYQSTIDLPTSGPALRALDTPE